MPAWMAMARMPLSSRFCTWSFMRAMSGVTTRPIPSRIRQGTWKQTLLPPPVGRMARTSLPSRASRIISSCLGLKLS